MKNITLLHYRLDQGGIDRVAALLANGFAHAGYNVTLLLFCNGGSGERLYFPEIDNPNHKNIVNIIYLGESKFSRSKDILYIFPKALKWLNNNPNDYIISTCNNMNWITALAAKRSNSNAKIIFKTTNPIVRKSDSALFAKLRKWGYAKAFNAADMILTLSEAESIELRNHFPSSADKFHTVINPYVSNEMLAVPEQRPRLDCISLQQKFILSIGRFEPQKNMALLIQSYAKLDAAMREDYHLIILGDGALKSECEALCYDLGVADTVIMPGFVGNVSDYLHAADLYMMTSVYEGLPAVIFEALAANCPILTTNCFLAAREIIESVAGCAIIENESPDNIAMLMQETLDTKIENQNLQYAAQKYSIHNGVADHIEKIIGIK